MLHSQQVLIIFLLQKVKIVFFKMKKGQYIKFKQKGNVIFQYEKGENINIQMFLNFWLTEALTVAFQATFSAQLSLTWT